ncbi:hypothetical protein GJU39_06380 [Pedobacter petrophilus]|uniref:Uncharacterized protein n=1 Tax=Pedobacter petrophilus TaxID=1908241 RepID=A0A7K0FWX5_9SPHI|nr:hypothetical protein [Pedobacter petrophilus]MRX75710.1 hypothetical protein [Pedobacter petrophilus]
MKRIIDLKKSRKTAFVFRSIRTRLAIQTDPTTSTITVVTTFTTHSPGGD